MLGLFNKVTGCLLLAAFLCASGAFAWKESEGGSTGGGGITKLQSKRVFVIQ